MQHQDVDGIVLLNLRDLGWGGDEKDPKSLAAFKQDHLYSAVLCCLNHIDDKFTANFPETLPRGTPAKVNVTTELAAVIKQLGFKDELKYDQLLYPNPSDTRKLLIWLVEQVPKGPIGEGSSSGGGSGSSSVPIGRLVSGELNRLLQETWAPLFARPEQARAYFVVSTAPLRVPARYKKPSAAVENYWRRYLPRITEQPTSRKQLAPSCFEAHLAQLTEQKELENEWNTKGLGTSANMKEYQKKKAENIARMMANIMKATINSIESESGQKFDQLSSTQQTHASQFERKKKFTTEEELDLESMQKLTEDELQEKREKELEELRETVGKLENNKEKLTNHIQTMISSIRQIEALMTEEDGKTETLTKQYKIKKRTMDLLPNAEENIAKLQEIATESSNRLVELALDWEKYRVPLIEQYRKYKADLASGKDQTKMLYEEIKEMRQEMKSIVEDVRNKDERLRELFEVFSKLNKDLNRSHYTDRILDIVKNVKKQKVDIDKILIDTRNLQKEINNITDTLGRTFAVTEELVFQDAQKGTASSPTAKEVYKSLVGLNKSFETLIKYVEEIGSCQNIILDLREKVTQMEERTNALNIERVQKDLEEIKKENKALLARLRGEK